MSGTPDYCVPVIAWRVWNAVESAGKTHLWSIYHPTLWPHRQALEARCGRKPLPFSPFRRALHAAPAERCLCGIYAGFADAVGNYLPNNGCLRPAAHPVVGRVFLWGEVVEYERGWRASRAYPERLYVPRLDLGDVAAARLARRLDAYGVPVDVLDEETADDAVAEIMCAVDECTQTFDRSGTVGAVIPETLRFWAR